MNKAKIRAVAVALLTGKLPNRRREIGYNQRKWHDTRGIMTDHSGRGCGTVCCVAGWTTALFAPRLKKGDQISRRARQILGLRAVEAESLFSGNVLHSLDREPTNKDAAMVLFNLAETGKVNWEIAK